MIDAVNNLDSKAGSVFDVSAVLTGLIVVAGVLSIGEVVDPEKEHFVWLYVFTGVLGAAVSFSFVSLLTALQAWRKAEPIILDPLRLTREFEDRTGTELRQFLIVELGAEFAEMAAGRIQTLTWLNWAFRSLGASVVTLLVYIALVLYVLVT